MACQLGHECAAESLNLGFALVAGIKVSTTFCSAHRQTRETILESLFESEKMQDTQIEFGVQS